MSRILFCLNAWLASTSPGTRGDFREANAEIDDLIAEFESWKTEQLLKLQSQQSEIWESSAEAKEELATELDKLRNKIDHYEAEVARVTGDLGAAEREVHLAEMEMDSAREAAEESIRLADVASAAFRPQVTQNPTRFR
jgi:chromosome segregation ATPase